MRKLLLVSVFILISIQTVHASQGFLSRIRGKIVDKETKAPLPGVNIQIVGTYLGGSSDANGEFLLKKIPLKTCTLRFSMIGYKKQEVADITLELGATADIPTVAMEPTIIGMDPVVVTASKQQQDLSVIPHSMSVVPEVEMVDRVPLRLDNALESVAGVHFVENHINIRGSSGYTRGVGSRVLLVIDEVPMMNSDNNEINWNILPILDIDKLEVIKGAGSALYGSNALGGVVNVITKSPTEKMRIKIRSVFGFYFDPPNAKTDMRSTEVDTQTAFPFVEWKWTEQFLHYSKYDVNLSKKTGNLGMNISLGYHKSTGYRTDDDFERFNTSTKLTWQFPDASNLTVYGGFSHEHRSEFIEWPDWHNIFVSSPFYSGAEYKLNAFDSYLLYHKPVTARAGIKFRVSYISSLMGDQYNRTNDYFPAEGFGSELKMDWMPHPAHNLTIGAEYRIDGGHTKYIGNHTGYSIAPYIQDQWQVFDEMTVTMGLRYDDYWLKDSGYRENYMNPKFGLNFTPFEGTILRFSAGTGFRAASIFERFLNFKYKLFTAVPNENLKAETSRSIDLGIHQQITNSWWIDAAVFSNRYFNYIEPVEEILDDFSLQVQFQNVRDARIQGVEVATKGSFFNDFLGLHANITYLDAKDLNRDIALTYRPRVIGFITGSVKIAPFEYQQEYRYARKFDEVMLYPYDYRVAQKVYTARLFLRLDHFTAIFSLNNMFNYIYTQLERNPKEPRNMTVTFMYDF